MHHAITVGDLLLIGGVVIGFFMAGAGALMTFASGMSDNPADGEGVGRQGLRIFFVGCALVLCGICGLIA